MVALKEAFDFGVELFQGLAQPINVFLQLQMRSRVSIAQTIFLSCNHAVELASACNHAFQALLSIG